MIGLSYKKLTPSAKAAALTPVILFSIIDDIKVRYVLTMKRRVGEVSGSRESGLGASPTPTLL